MKCSVFPFLNWFPLGPEKWKADIIAGITVALLLIPQSMAYADLAGLPYIYGLHAAFIPTLIGALFGHSNHLSTGPVAMTSMLIASVLIAYAEPGSPAYIQLAIILSLMIGLTRLVIGLLKFTRISNLISYPVILGFTNAAAILIGYSQVSKLLNISIHKIPGFLGTAREAITLMMRFQEAHVPTLLMGLLAFLLILLFDRIKKVPSILLSVVITTLLSLLVSYESRWGGSVIGEIPKGLPFFGLPFEWQEIPELLPIIIRMIPASLMVVLIGFLEVLSVSKSVSIQSGQRMNYQQEMIGQGLACLAGGFSSSYPVSGSFSRTALSYISGARTGMAQVVTSLVVLLVLLFFTPLFYHLPTPVLAVSIMMAVKRLIDFKKMAYFWRQSKREFFLSFLTFILTLFAAPNLTMGILMGVGVSLLLFLVLDRPGGFTDPELNGDVLILRIRRTILFTGINQLEESVLDKMIRLEKAKYLKIKARSLKKIDISGLEGLNRLASKFKERGGAMVFIGLPPSMHDFLQDLRNVHFFEKEEDFHNYQISLALDELYNREGLK